MRFDLNNHLLIDLIRMTKCLVNLMSEVKNDGADLKSILLDIQTELFSTESIVKAKQLKLIEEVFDPSLPYNMPQGVIKLKLKGGVPELFFLN